MRMRMRVDISRWLNLIWMGWCWFVLSYALCSLCFGGLYTSRVNGSIIWFGSPDTGFVQVGIAGELESQVLVVLCQF